MNVESETQLNLLEIDEGDGRTMSTISIKPYGNRPLGRFPKRWSDIWISTSMFMPIVIGLSKIECSTFTEFRQNDFGQQVIRLVSVVGPATNTSHDCNRLRWHNSWHIFVHNRVNIFWFIFFLYNPFYVSSWELLTLPPYLMDTFKSNVVLLRYFPTSVCLTIIWSNSWRKNCFCK